MRSRLETVSRSAGGVSQRNNNYVWTPVDAPLTTRVGVENDTKMIMDETATEDGTHHSSKAARKPNKKSALFHIIDWIARKENQYFSRTSREGQQGGSGELQ